MFENRSKLIQFEEHRYHACDVRTNNVKSRAFHGEGGNTIDNYTNRNNDIKQNNETSEVFQRVYADHTFISSKTKRFCMT